MRILQISAAYKPAYIYGGPTMSVAMLCEQLATGGCDITVYTTTANGGAELDVIPNQPVLVDDVKVTYFKRITKDHSHFSPALLWAAWKNVRSYQLVHIHAWWNLVSVLSALIGIIRGVPVLVSARGTLSPYSFQNKNTVVKSLLHKLIGKPVLNRSHFHTTSKQESDAISDLLKPKSITVLPNFVKLPPMSPGQKTEITAPVRLIFFSRIEEKKGLDILIEALSLVNVPFQLTVAGDGNSDYVNSLKALAANYNLADKITWLGFVADDKFEVLKQQDLFILPSYDENFGNAVIESLSVGTPVLVSEGVGLADYVLENNLGWVCKNNAVSVSEAINFIVTDDRNKMEIIRKTAPYVIYSNFDPDILVKRYIDMYHEIINNG